MTRHVSRLEAAALRRQARDAIGRPAPASGVAQALPADDATKGELISWLAERGIAAGPRMSKPKLWTLVLEET